MTKINVTLAAALVFLSTFNSVQANHIDFIVDGGFFLATSDSGGFIADIQSGDSGNLLGSEREISIGVASGVGFVSAGTVGAEMGTGPVGPDTSKTLQFSNSVAALGRFELTFDGVGSSGLGGADFDTRWDSLVVDFQAVQGAGELTLAVVDTAAGNGSLTLPVSSAGLISFPFSSFSTVDFTTVDSVQFTLATTEAASDFSIGGITREITPEPSAGLMAAIGLLGFHYFRRRREAK